MQGLRVLTRSGAAPTSEEIASAHIVANTHREMKFGTIMATEQANGVEVEYHAHKRLAFVSSGGMFGGAYLDTLYARNSAWYGGLTRMQGLGSFPGSTRDSALYTKETPASTVAYGSAFVSSRWRGVFWGADGAPVDMTIAELLGIAAPNGAVLTYSQSIVAQVSQDGSTALAKMMTDGLLWPRAYLWSSAAGARDLGFMDDVRISLSAYPYTTSNLAASVGMSDDGAVVFANHGAQTYYSGGYEGFGAMWKESTGWIRVPVPAGYVPKTPGDYDTSAHHVNIAACSADGAGAVGQVLSHNAALTQPRMPVIWREGVGTDLLPAIGAATENTRPLAMSRSGEFALLADVVSGDMAVWSAAAGLVSIPLLYSSSSWTRYAVDDDGTAYGLASTADGVFAARHSLAGGTVVYEVPAGAISSEPLFIGRRYVAGRYTLDGVNYAQALWGPTGALVTVPDEVSGLASPVIRAVPDPVTLALGSAVSSALY